MAARHPTRSSVLLLKSSAYGAFRNTCSLTTLVIINYNGRFLADKITSGAVQQLALRLSVACELHRSSGTTLLPAMPAVLAPAKAHTGSALPYRMWRLDPGHGKPEDSGGFG